MLTLKALEGAQESSEAMLVYHVLFSRSKTIPTIEIMLLARAESEQACRVVD